MFLARLGGGTRRQRRSRSSADRAPDYESGGQRFESFRARQKTQQNKTVSPKAEPRSCKAEACVSPVSVIAAKGHRGRSRPSIRLGWYGTSPAGLRPLYAPRCESRSQPRSKPSPHVCLASQPLADDPRLLCSTSGGSFEGGSPDTTTPLPTTLASRADTGRPALFVLI